MQNLDVILYAVVAVQALMLVLIVDLYGRTRILIRAHNKIAQFLRSLQKLPAKVTGGDDAGA